MRRPNGPTLGRWAVGALTAALIGFAAGPAGSQQMPGERYEPREPDGRQRSVERRDGQFHNFLPRSLQVTFSTLIVRLDDRGRLEIDYEVERGSWDRLQREEIGLWLEMWVPLEPAYYFVAFPRLRDVRRVDRREGTFRFPYWVVVDRHNAVTLCPLARTVVYEPREIVGWACGGGPKDFRPRSSWGPQLSAGTSFTLRREYEPLQVFQWYWIYPFGWFTFPRPLPDVLPPQLPRRDPREGLSFPPGRRP